MAEPSLWTRYRFPALAAAGIAAACGAYLLYSTRSSPPVKTSLHRRNAVHRARGNPSRPRIELGAPDTEAPLGRLTLRQGSNVLVTNLAQLRFPSVEQITTTFGPHAIRVHDESVSVGLNAIFLSCLRARSPESRQLLASIGLRGLPEAVVARDEELCRAIVTDAMPDVPELLINQALQGVFYGDRAIGHGTQSAAPEIAETEITSSPPGAVPDQGIKGLLYYIAEEDSKREAYEHRGITCEECGEFPIRGVRWHCLNCPDYDLCTTCEAHSLHERTHVFVKIKIPLPVMSQPSDAQPPYYTGRLAAASQDSLDGATRKRLAQQSGFPDHKLDALYDQFMSVANVPWANDPAKIKIAIDSRAFAKAMTPSNWTTQPALSTVYDSMFAFYDTNKDDLIGFMEFVDGMAYLRGPQRFSPLSRALKCFDIDDDDLVERRDIVRILKAKSVLDRQLTRDAVARAEPEKAEAALDALGPSQPISSIFHEEEIPQGEGRVITSKGINCYGDMEPVSGANTILDDADPWPQQNLLRFRVGFAESVPLHERLHSFSPRFEEMLHSPPSEEPRGDAAPDAVEREPVSISVSANDQAGFREGPSGLSVDSDVGILSDLLTRHVEAGIDELLDPIFLFKEEQFTEVRKSREDRKKWRAEIDEYAREKKAFQDELRSLSQSDPLLATAMNSTGKLSRKPRPSRHQSEDVSEPAFRGEIVPTDEETLTRRAREIAERPLEELLSATGYRILDPNETDRPHSADAKESRMGGDKDSSSSSPLDPTLPQNRPSDVFLPTKGQTPSKRRMEEYMHHDEIEREAEQRGGPGRLTLHELESILVADRTQSLRGMLLGWLELASF